MHRIDNPQIAQRRIRNFAVDEHSRNYTDDLTQLVQRRIRERSHQSDARAAIDDPDSARGNERPKIRGSNHIVTVCSRIRSTKNCEPADLAHARGRIAAIMLTPSPASDCPPSHTTTAPVMKLAAS